MAKRSTTSTASTPMELTSPLRVCSVVHASKIVSYDVSTFANTLKLK